MNLKQQYHTTHVICSEEVMSILYLYEMSPCWKNFVVSRPGEVIRKGKLNVKGAFSIYDNRFICIGNQIIENRHLVPLDLNIILCS